MITLLEKTSSTLVCLQSHRLLSYRQEQQRLQQQQQQALLASQPQPGCAEPAGHASAEHQQMTPQGLLGPQGLLDGRQQTAPGPTALPTLDPSATDAPDTLQEMEVPGAGAADGRVQAQVKQAVVTLATAADDVGAAATTTRAEEVAATAAAAAGGPTDAKGQQDDEGQQQQEVPLPASDQLTAVGGSRQPDSQVTRAPAAAPPASAADTPAAPVDTAVVEGQVTELTDQDVQKQQQQQQEEEQQLLMPEELEDLQQMLQATLGLLKYQSYSLRGNCNAASLLPTLLNLRRLGLRQHMADLLVAVVAAKSYDRPSMMQLLVPLLRKVSAAWGWQAVHELVMLLKVQLLPPNITAVVSTARQHQQQPATAKTQLN